MASKVSIANRALAKLGEDRILLLTDDNKRARTINQMFDDVLDAELRRYRWKFTITRAELPALAEAPAWGYLYQYPLPADYLALVQVNDIYVRAGTGVALWQVESGNILTNIEAPLKVRYVKRVTNPGLFDAMFCEVLADRLAMEACETLTQSETKFTRVATQYKQDMQDAMRQDAIENPPDELPQGSWLDARNGDYIPGTTQDVMQYPSGFTV